MRAHLAPQAAKHLQRIHQRIEPEVMLLGDDDLLDLLRTRSNDAITARLPLSDDKECTELRHALDSVRVADWRATSVPNPLERLLRQWRSQGKSSVKLNADIHNALRSLRTEYFFLPTLPAENEIGYIVLLREVRAIHRSRLFPSRLQLRLAPDDGRKAFRIGRMAPYLKYALVHQFAQLFARPALPNSFEEESEAAINIVAEIQNAGSDEAGV